MSNACTCYVAYNQVGLCLHTLIITASYTASLAGLLSATESFPVEVIVYYVIVVVVAHSSPPPNPSPSRCPRGFHRMITQ